MRSRVGVAILRRRGGRRLPPNDRLDRLAQLHRKQHVALLVARLQDPLEEYRDTAEDRRRQDRGDDAVAQNRAAKRSVPVTATLASRAKLTVWTAATRAPKCELMTPVARKS